ncbi:hypothetical protein [Bradyrhizobium sp. CCGUVB14]|uniref:hypothetical protein n=1 Tax=Bradyrhizobium sp. CCGUVB14 TaxID=2949628 RepID=UPI0020B1B45D|nr:hypothetical protein [Bradyrhizobium sp. CCGUVB14]MCP3441146.1 hypothetical protein [Bradyrhizobium sp. CCGUVB14]
MCDLGWNMQRLCSLWHAGSLTVVDHADMSDDQRRDAFSPICRDDELIALFATMSLGSIAW